MSNPYRTADTPETIPAQNSSKFPLDIEASDPDALLGAVDDYRASPHRHELARTAEDAAAARAGRHSEARASAAEAFQLYSGMGLAGKRPWRRAQRGGGRGTACPGAPGGGPR